MITNQQEGTHMKEIKEKAGKIPSILKQGNLINAPFVKQMITLPGIAQIGNMTAGAKGNVIQVTTDIPPTLPRTKEQMSMKLI